MTVCPGSGPSPLDSHLAPPDKAPPGDRPIMVRSTSPLLLLLTLALGVLLGLNLDRGRRTVSAQARPPGAGGLAERGRRARAPTSAPIRGPGEDGDLRPARPPVCPVRARQPDLRAGRQGGLAVGRPPRRPQGRQARGRAARRRVRGDRLGRDRPGRGAPGPVRADEQPRRRRRRRSARSTSSSATAGRSTRSGSGPTARPTSPS